MYPENQLNQPNISQEPQPDFQPEAPKKFDLPTWFSILIVASVVIVISLVSWAAYRAFNPSPVACTKEAKVCPDGTTVGRIGPNCKFAPCPPTQTPPDETADWKTYKLDFLEIKYPLSFFADGFPDENLGISLEIRNFQWNRDGYGFPYIKYPPQDNFYMEIKSIDNSDNLSIKDWLDKQKDNYVDLEEVQIINEYKQIYGTLVSEKSITIDNRPALQRIIGYKGNAGNVNIIFSYVNYKSQMYQFVGHSTTDNNLKVYNQILSTFKFIE